MPNLDAVMTSADDVWKDADLGGAVQIVVIATRWGTFEGGLNAFNRYFTEALAMVGLGHVEITCAVTQASAADVIDARQAGVRLLAIGSAAEEPTDAAGRLIIGHLIEAGQDVEVALWVGHDVKTGFAAVEATRRMGGRTALIHHMRYASYRNLVGGQGESTGLRDDAQMDLFSTTDALLFGVGEDLRESVGRLGGRNAFCIVPGFPDDFCRNSAGDRRLYIVVAGRFDAETEPLKQSRLVAAGLGRAIRRSGPEHRVLVQAELVIFGASENTIEKAELEQLVRQEAGRAVAVTPRGFNAERGIIGHLARANLAVMPSVREGFGLVGWEAIGCEVPLIVGADTGLASFLQDIFDGHANRYVWPVELTGLPLADEDIDRMAEAMTAVARDVWAARRKAVDLRARLKEQFRGCT